MSKTTTKFKGVYKNTSNGKYYYATKIKMDDGTFKSIKSKSIYDSALTCYADLIKIKDGSNDNLPTNTTTKPKPKEKLISFENVANDWLLVYKTKVKESSYYYASQHLKSTLIPLFKDYNINQLCTINTLTEFKEHLRNKPICNVYRNKLINIYISICEHSFYLNYINQQEYGFVKLHLTRFNDVSEVTPSKAKKREKLFYTLEEVNSFLNVIEDELHKLMFQFMFYGGFRIGELIAITPTDIDQEKQCIIVNKSVNILRNVTTPKTKNSYRSVYLKRSLIDSIVSYVNKNNLKANDMIFDYSKEYITQLIQKYSKSCKLEHLNPHGFRHSCCSYLFQKYKEHNIAVDFKQVAEHLGDSVDTVLNVYYHIYESEKTRIINLLD